MTDASSEIMKPPKSFRLAFFPILVFCWVLSLIAYLPIGAMALPTFQDAFPPAMLFNIILLGIVIMSLFSYCVAIIVVAMFPQKVTSTGIRAQNFWLLTQTVPWEAMKNVTENKRFGFGYLELNYGDNEIVFIPYAVDSLAKYGETVLAYAPDGNPLKKIFTPEVSPETAVEDQPQETSTGKTPVG